MQLEDKFKQIDQKNTNLQAEIKYLMKIKEEHKRCLEKTQNYDIETKNLKEEIYHLKTKEKDLNSKLEEEVNKHGTSKSQLSKIQTKLESQKKECMNLKRTLIGKEKLSINERSSSLPYIVNSTSPNNNEEKNYIPYYNQYDPYSEIKKQITENKAIKKKQKAKDDSSLKTKKDLEKTIKANENLKNINSQYLSKSLLFSGRVDNLNAVNTLFSKAENEYLIQLLSKDDIGKYEARFDIAEKERIDSQKTYKKEIKALSKKDRSD